MKWVIYALVDPTSRLVRYVGQSSSGLCRPRHHGRPSQLKRKPGHRSSWIASLHQRGLDYEIAILQVLSGADGLNEAECWWIAYGRLSGWPLTNHTDGGEGTRGLLFSAEHRRRLSEAHRGQALSAEHRAKIAQGNIGRATTDTMRHRTAAANRARIWTPESRAKLSASRGGISPSPEAREKQRQAMVGYKFGPPNAEKRKRLSEALKGRPLSMATRVRMSLARKRPPRLRINLLPRVA